MAPGELDMDLLFKALATTGLVAGLLLLLRQAGPRLGGLAAALPLSSAPTLFWLGVEQGSAFASAAATAALLSTALTPLLVGVYARLSPRRGPLACLLAGLGLSTAVLLLLQSWVTLGPAAGLGLALGLSALVLRLLPRPAPARPRQGNWRTELLLTATVAGLLTLSIGALSQVAGASACGLLAAFPVVGLSTLWSTHQGQGASVACSFVAGYVDGNAAKAVFLALLAAALGSLSPAGAWILALAGGLFTLLLLRHPVARRGAFLPSTS